MQQERNLLLEVRGRRLMAHLLERHLDVVDQPGVGFKHPRDDRPG